jgi:glycosyltransferase involved in cell wall biosynthesis
MHQISAVIITFNEERNIGRCLESLEGVADEIVVVDSFSTDKTLEICKSFRAKVFQHPFEGHIEQKNWAITKASFPHILSLDADEALSEELKNAIVEVKNNWGCDGYLMNRLSNYCGHWIRFGGWYPDTKLRLWDSRKGCWGGNNPHDRFEFFEKSATIGKLSGDILHFSYYTRQEHTKRIVQYGQIGASAIRKANEGGLWWKRWVNPPVKFFRNYLLKFGFLDGSDGLFIAYQAMMETWIKYSYKP